MTAPVLINKTRAIGNRLLETLLPCQCVNCGNLTATAKSLCVDCWQELNFIAPPLCDRMGIPFEYDPGPGIISTRALAKPPGWQRARAGVEYTERARELVHALKYRDRHEVLHVMAEIMTHAGHELISQADVIIPVPLFRLRLWQRRFNQSALLAKSIAKRTGLPYQPEWLVRTRATRQQVGLTGPERQKNVKDAFKVPAAHHIDVRNARVLLVDDVITTGATANACCAALSAAGCRHIDLLGFALVNNPLHSHF